VSGEVREQADPRPQWRYGPSASDPDPAKVWCEGCGDEVLWFDGVGVCDCGQWSDDE
jgi:hypothetical protein